MGRQLGSLAVLRLGIHRTEQPSDDLVRVAGIAGRELLDGRRKKIVAVEDAGIFGEVAEDETGHELVEVRTARFRRPVLVLLQQLNIKLVETVGRPDVDRVVFDLADRRNAGQWQQQTKVCRKVGILTNPGLAR